MDNHQRKDAISNAHAGREFELLAQQFFEKQDLRLEQGFKVEVGINEKFKYHNFDLGSENPSIIVECKSHRWTSGNNVPSAKLTVWNEAMYYFLATPKKYRKIFFVLRDISVKRNESLASYYIRTYGHLVPPGVEIWEYDAVNNIGHLVYGRV